MGSIIPYVCYLLIPLLLAAPLGVYISRVMNGENVFLSRLLSPVERAVYRVLGIDSEEEMGWRKYLKCVLVFSGMGILALFLLQMLQGYLPLNPQGAKGMAWDLALNAAVSFVTNTNWQAYSGESQVSYLTQSLGLTVQNFVSAGTGIAVLYALIRGFVRVQEKGVGNFWRDLTRAVLYLLLPLSLALGLLLVSQGVPQSLQPAKTAALLEPAAFDAKGNYIEDAVISEGRVTVDGEIIEDAEVVTEGMVPLGMAASQIAIKQLGTNGGGYYGANSAHPLENPTGLSNLGEMLSILLIPAALCFAFGREVQDRRQGNAIFSAMFLLLAAALAVIAVNEQTACTVLKDSGMVDLASVGQAGGNMEGKEARFGIAASSVWAAFTTAASNGSVNAMADSFTPLGGLMMLLLIQLGEVVFGGAGSGLYGMLAFVILAVFIAGLMVGRTPEYLGKKIEPGEMKNAMLVCLAMPVLLLAGCGAAAAIPGIADSLGNTGPHGFTELLYAFTSASGNNGSAFAGFQADTPLLNLSLGVCMLLGRFVPIAGILAIAGSMAGKKKTAVTAGTLSTGNAMFVFLLIFVVLLVGALSFFPALALGPLAEFF